MSKYTPGPWFHLGMGDIVQKADDYCGDIKDIAAVYLTLGEEDEANARLITAAPELLEMLCTALPFVEDAELDPAYKAGHAAQVAAQIRTLIAKATGES
jgi:hypothetical protein